MSEVQKTSWTGQQLLMHSCFNSRSKKQGCINDNEPQRLKWLQKVHKNVFRMKQSLEIFFHVSVVITQNPKYLYDFFVAGIDKRWYCVCVIT